MLTARRRFVGLVALLACVVLVAAGCSKSVADQPPAPTPTPTPAPSLRPMKQPIKPYPVPTMSAAPKKADELATIGYRLQRVVWASLGTAAPATSVSCHTTNAKLVRPKAELTFGCDVKATGTTTHFAVTTKTGPTSIDWSYKVTALPLTERKVEYEMARQSFEPARVTCDVFDTALVPVGDADAITCWVSQTDNTSVTYRGGLEDSGVITFQPVPTSTKAAAARPSASPKPTSSKGAPSPTAKP